MKKYLVKSCVLQDQGSGLVEWRECYECEGIAFAKNWTGECIRLEDVNSVKGNKRKQFKRGVYVTINKMPSWKSFEVVVLENGSNNIVHKWEG